MLEQNNIDAQISHPKCENHDNFGANRGFPSTNHVVSESSQTGRMLSETENSAAFLRLMLNSLGPSGTMLCLKTGAGTAWW
jgi:hypothetical protein